MDMGLIWDKYDSRLKAQMLVDLMCLVDGAGLKRVQVKAPDGENTDWLNAQLDRVGVQRVEGLLPKTWRAYTVLQEPEMPEECEDWIVKDLRIEQSEGVRMTPNVEKYPDLTRQSDERMVPPGLSMMLNKKPPVRPSGNNGIVLPQNFWYSPFI